MCLKPNNLGGSSVTVTALFACVLLVTRLSLLTTFDSYLTVYVHYSLTATRPTPATPLPGKFAIVLSGVPLNLYSQVEVVKYTSQEFESQDFKKKQNINSRIGSKANLVRQIGGEIYGESSKSN